VIRNYDPCISCATHFLNLNLVRDGIAEHGCPNDMPTFKNIDLTRSAIIGVGSPNEGDEYGWQMLDRLEQHNVIASLVLKGLKLYKLDRPGMLIAESIKDFDHVLIIDAIKSSDAKSSMIFIDMNQLSSLSGQISSHETGVLESFALLKSLKTLPKQVVVAGVTGVNDKNVEKIISMF
jgi:hydrogenase maturation protease